MWCGIWQIQKKHNEQGIFKYEARRKRFHFICILVLLHRKYFCDKKKEKRKRYTDMYLNLHVYFPVISPY